jgi:hypothetical protein
LPRLDFPCAVEGSGSIVEQCPRPAVDFALQLHDVSLAVIGFLPCRQAHHALGFDNELARMVKRMLTNHRID